MDLRDTVYELKRRRHEAKTQNELLKQLSGLWERLCSEVESEIQDGVRQQLNFNIPSFEEAMTNNRRISPAENQEINTKLNSIRNSRLSIPILNQPHYPLEDQQLDSSHDTSFERCETNNTSFERCETNNTPFERCDTKEDTITNIATNLSKESLSGPITVDADIMANLLLTNTTDGVLHFDTNDRGAMEL